MFAQKMKIYSILCLTCFKQKLDKPGGLFLPERCVRTRVSMMQLQDLHLYLNITLPLVFFIYLSILRTESTFSPVFCFRNRKIQDHISKMIYNGALLLNDLSNESLITISTPKKRGSTFILYYYLCIF